MTLYLVKLIKNSKWVFKSGHTKEYHVDKRFEEDIYKKFDNIECLYKIHISHKDYKTAKVLVELMEKSFQLFYKKDSDFKLETFFEEKENYFNDENGNPMSGITETFVYNNEEKLIRQFKALGYNMLKMLENGNNINIGELDIK
tara:strand:+ start:477 stop:908 length:432 start_codon:yes stop_codon:yes gene_type:complete